MPDVQLTEELLDLLDLQIASLSELSTAVNIFIYY